jgi:protease-4
MNINLIDEYGGLDDAITGASKLANMTDYRIYELPKQQDPIQKLFSQIEKEVKISWLKLELGDQYKYYKTLEDLKDLKGIQARMPYQFTID